MITEADATELRRLFPELDPGVVGASTDLECFQPPGESRDPLLISHVGTLTEFTKLEAVLWFWRDVFPLVRQKRTQARLELVGWALSSGDSVKTSLAPPQAS